MPTRPRIYLAGPEVFLPDARAAGQRKIALCAEAGFEGAFPLDQELDLAGLPKHEMARRISLANEGLMRTCDLLIANMTPFRGVSMDTGTAFEMGFMRALGRPVLAYSNSPRNTGRGPKPFVTIRPFRTTATGPAWRSRTSTWPTTS